MKVVTTLALISLGIILPIWFMDAMELQASIDAGHTPRLARTDR